jgi:hypothetical protein
MSNPIKYSTGSESLALKTGNFYIGTGDVGKGPTSTTGYYNGITPPSGGYTIYLNKATGGPSIYTCANDTELISLTNSIAGTSYTTANECFVYFAGQTDKMVLNRDYEGIVTDGLVYNIDSSFVSSYPKNGTTWYDLSGNGNDGTLLNGPTYNTSNGGVIIFDGIDDKLNSPSSSVYDFTYNNGFSLESFCYATSQSSSGMIPIIERYYWNTTGYGGYVLRLRQYSTNWPEFVVTGRPSGSGVLDTRVRATTEWVANTWYHLVGTKSTDGTMKIYVNGVLEGTTTGVTSIPLPQTGVTLKIAARGDTNDQYSNQRFGVCRIYNKELSASEVLQNYNAQKGRFGL